MKHAYLVFHQKTDYRGNVEQIRAEWNGPNDGVTTISGELISEITDKPVKVGDIVLVYQYKLKCFEIVNFPYYEYRFIRADSILGNIRIIVYKSTRWLDLIYRRLIITASVWKLADYDPTAYPYWGDLHIVKWVRGLKRQNKRHLWRKALRLAKRWMYQFLKFAFGLFGYMYFCANLADYSEMSKKIVLKKYNEKDSITDTVTECLIPKDTFGFGYGLVRRLSLNENGHAYQNKQGNAPETYWQFGKFMMYFEDESK